MMINNFLFRLGQWVRENEQKIIKAALVIFGAILIIWLIFYGLEKWQTSRYEKKVEALEAEIRQEEAKAKEAERIAELLKNAIEAKYAQIEAIQRRAETAETALRNARGKVVTLKEVYEEIRNSPMPLADVSCADACAKLAALGYECQ